MSSNGEDIIRETFEKLGDAIGVQMQIPDAMITNLGAVLQAQIDLLAELQSTGRLLADDEQRLTAEQVEDVRAAREELRGYRNFTGYGRSHVNRLIAAVDALFPATEPAEDSVGDPLQAWKEFLKPKPIGWYRTMELDFAAKHFGFPSNPVFEDRYTAPDGGKWQWTDELQWELRCYPPAPAEPAEAHCTVPPEGWWCSRAANHDGPCAASEGVAPWVPQPLEADWLDQVDPRDPQSRTHRETAAAKFAEPAEEETKADCLYCDLLCGPHEAHKDWTPLPAHFLAPTASSPVVPAPTETGPKTWCAITGADSSPGGEHAYVTVRVPKEFVSGQSMADLAGAGKSRELARLLAPFVAAKEGRA